MSLQVDELTRPGGFTNLPKDPAEALVELARRLSDFERVLIAHQAELNRVLAQKPDKNELLPTSFKS